MGAEKLALASTANVGLGVLQLRLTKQVEETHIASVEKIVAAILATVQKVTRLLVESHTVNVGRIVLAKHAPVPGPKCSQ